MMFLTFHILGRIISTDFHIFFRGVGIPPTSHDLLHQHEMRVSIRLGLFIIK